MSCERRRGRLVDVGSDGVRGDASRDVDGGQEPWRRGGGGLVAARSWVGEEDEVRVVGWGGILENDGGVGWNHVTLRVNRLESSNEF